MGSAARWWWRGASTDAARRLETSRASEPGRHKAVGIALSLLVALITATPSFAQDAAWDKVLAEAKKEGTVVLYTTFLGSPQQLALIKRFEAETGITVQLLDVRASELGARIRAEQSSGRYIADLFINSGDAINIDNRAGLIGSLDPVPNMKNVRADMAGEITSIKTPAYMVAYGLLINTNLVKGGDVPKSWQDLNDPKWKGKILSDDVRAPGGGFVFFSATLGKFGRGFHEALAKQEPVFSRDPGQDQLRVARGEYPLRMPQVFPTYLLMRGLPVNIVIPQEGSPYIRFDLALAKNAPHPNAARVMINWYLSADTQVGLGDQALVPAVAGLEARIKPEARALAAVPLLGTTNPATRDAELDLAKQIYK